MSLALYPARVRSSDLLDDRRASAALESIVVSTPYALCHIPVWKEALGKDSIQHYRHCDILRYGIAPKGQGARNPKCKRRATALRVDLIDLGQ